MCRNIKNRVYYITMKKTALLFAAPILLLGLVILLTGCIRIRTPITEGPPDDPGILVPEYGDERTIFFLDAPTDLFVDENNILRWTFVENATSYNLSVDGEILFNSVTMYPEIDLAYSTRQGQTHTIGLQAVRYFGEHEFPTKSEWSFTEFHRTN